MSEGLVFITSAMRKSGFYGQQQPAVMGILDGKDNNMVAS